MKNDCSVGTPLSKLNGLDWTWDDLNKKFFHSFVKAKLGPNEPEQIIFIHDVNPVAVAYNVYDEKEKTYLKLQKISSDNLLITQERPDPCISNAGETDAFIFCYNPERQWKRGFADHNCFLHWGKYTKDGPFSRGSITGEYTSKIISPQHSHLADALKNMKNDSAVQARALTNDYWLIRAGDFINLYRKRAFLGGFKGNKFFLNESAKIMQKELEMELPILKEKYGCSY